MTVIRNPGKNCSIVAAAMLVMVFSSKLAAQATNDSTYVPPQLINAEDAGKEIGRLYPEKLRELQISGFVLLRLVVGADGEIRRRSILVTSGVRAFDRAAERVTDMLKLKPATRRGVAVLAEMRLPVRFQAKPRRGVQHLTSTRLLNRDSIVARAFDSYPTRLRAEAVNTFVAITLEIDRKGKVTSSILNQSSCFPAADELALSVSRLLRFAPLTADKAEHGQVNVTFAFQNDSVHLNVAGDTVQDASRYYITPGRPTYTVKPELTNRAEFERALIDIYPRELAVRGERAEVLAWLLIDEQGNVARRQITDTSGSCAVDLAAFESSKVARFTPALLDDKPVRVWIQLPIIFQDTRLKD